jgi:hypothetical protein
MLAPVLLTLTLMRCPPTMLYQTQLTTTLSIVMAGLVPAIHVFKVATLLRRGCHSRSKNGVLSPAYE